MYAAFSFKNIQTQDPADIHHCLISLSSIVHTSYSKKERRGKQEQKLFSGNRNCSRAFLMQNWQLATPAREGTGRKPSRMGGAGLCGRSSQAYTLFEGQCRFLSFTDFTSYRLLVNFTSCPSLPLPASSIYLGASLCFHSS